MVPVRIKAAIPVHEISWRKDRTAFDFHAAFIAVRARCRTAPKPNTNALHLPHTSNLSEPSSIELCALSGREPSRGCAVASRVDDLPEERYQALYAVMMDKYAKQSSGTNVFYAVLGGRRDRVGLLLEIGTCG